MLAINEIYVYTVGDTTGQSWAGVDADLNLTFTKTKTPGKFALVYASDYYGSPCYYIFSYYSQKFLKTNGLDHPITATGVGPNLTSFQLRDMGSGPEVWTTDDNPLIWKIEGEFIVGGNNTNDATFNFVSSPT